MYIPQSPQSLAQFPGTTCTEHTGKSVFEETDSGGLSEFAIEDPQESPLVEVASSFIYTVEFSDRSSDYSDCSGILSSTASPGPGCGPGLRSRTRSRAWPTAATSLRK